MIYLTDYRIVYTKDSELLDDLAYPQKVHWFPDTYNRVNTGIFYPPHKLADKVLDPNLIKRLRENPVGRTAFILAAGNTNFAGTNRNIKPTRLSYSYKFLPFTLTQVYAGRIAQSCGATDLITTDSTACASSLKVLMDVKTLIENYGFQRVIVLAVEDQVSNSVLDFFGEARASLSKDETDSGVMPSAFDDENYGFHVGQGAAFAVFEHSDVADKVIARLHGAYAASEECSNAIGQREDGQGFIKAVQGAMWNSDLGTEEKIKIVKTHGTGTRSNNVAEKAALEFLLDDFVATSYKPTIGHTMGASGLLETCLMIEEIRAGKLSGIANRTQTDARYLSHAIVPPDGLILSLAAGMGNVYAAAVLSVEK